MKSIDILRAEHAMILVVLDELDKTAERIVKGNQRPTREFMEGVLDFCRTFADRFHHYKEEYVMFGMLAQKYDGAIDAEVERHRTQHEQLRDLVGAISGALDQLLKGSDSAARDTHGNIVDYVTQLRSHIRSENEVFFPMVEQAITDSEDEKLLAEFKKYEDGDGGDLRETYRERVAALCEANL